MRYIKSAKKDGVNGNGFNLDDFKQLQRRYTTVEEELVSIRLENLTLKTENMILREENRRDMLTGISNERRMNEALLHHMALLKRKKQPLSFIYIDMNNLKETNSLFGYEDGGDAALKIIAKTLDNLVRKNQDLVGRIHGDEFGVLLPNTDEVGAKKFKAKVKEALSKLVISNIHGRFTITVSTGSGTINRLIGKSEDVSECIMEIKKSANAALDEDKKMNKHLRRK